MFGGKAMTYYGRWTYKYEKAAEMGAAGCLIVHETEPAGYPWEVVPEAGAASSSICVAADKNMRRAGGGGMDHSRNGGALFKAAGQDFAKMKRGAVSKDFQPVPLGLKAQMEIHNTLRRFGFAQRDCEAEGSDPKLKDQYVIYSAHWDHFGIGREVNGDKIYHGAIDNASGVAALLEIARAFQQLRSAAEAKYAVFGGNRGGARPAGVAILCRASALSDCAHRGGYQYGRDEYAGRERAISRNWPGEIDAGRSGGSRGQGAGRAVKADPEPEKGYFYRSDHFSFAKEGVPAFDPDEGIDFIGKPAG